MPTVAQLRSTHPEYVDNVDNWQYTLDHYDAARWYDNIADYVPQKILGEKDNVYEERLAITKFLNVMAAVIDSVVGGVARKGDQTVIDWGILRDAGIVPLLEKDADLKGTSYEHLQQQKLTDALVFNLAYTLVDTTRDGGEATSVAAGFRPYISLVPRISLVNWRMDREGRMVEALIEEEMDLRVSIFDQAAEAAVATYLWMDLTGWARFRIKQEDDTGEEVVEMLGGDVWMDASGSVFQWKGLDGRPRLPLVTTNPRLRRYAGFELAQLANEIANINSELRYILRFGGLGQFLVINAEDEAFDNALDKIRSGDRVIQEDKDAPNTARFIGPDMAVVTGLTSTLEAKITQFWQAALFEFSDSAVERTATEIAADFNASMGAFLASLSQAAEESENEELYLLAQAVGFQGDATSPEVPSVTRARDFSTEDGIAVLTRARDLLLGQNATQDLPDEIKARLALRSSVASGLFTEEEADELEQAVLNASKEADARRAAAEAAAAQPPPPPPAAAEGTGDIVEE